MLIKSEKQIPYVFSPLNPQIPKIQSDHLYKVVNNNPVFLEKTLRIKKKIMKIVIVVPPFDGLSPKHNQICALWW